MSLFDCLQRAVEADEADAARAQYAQELWKELSDRYAGAHPRAKAEALAAEDVRNALKREYGQKRHEYLAKMADVRKAEGDVARATDLAHLPGNTIWTRIDSKDAFVTDAESLRRSMVERFNWRMGEFLNEHYKPMLRKHRDEAGQLEIAKAMRGEETSDPKAKMLADLMTEVLEELRLHYNAAGGSIGKLDGYIPQKHNARAIRRRGFDRWYDDVVNKLDWERIPDHMTGRPMAQVFGDMSPKDALASKQRFLREIYDSITSDGATKLEPVYGRPFGESMSRRRNHERVLHFKNTDDWVAYNRDYGNGDIFAGLVSHVHVMARDIALMRSLGPNPKAGLAYRAELAIAKAGNAEDGALAGRVRKDAQEAETMLALYTGSKQPQTEVDHVIATAFATTRTLMTAAHLDRAVLANLSDMNTIRVAARTSGLNQQSLFNNTVQALAGMKKQELLQMGHIAATLGDPGVIQARFLSEYQPLEFASRISNAVFRAQGLSHLTDQTRMVFRMEQEAQFARNAGKRIAEVEPELRDRLRRYGVTDQEWMALTDQRFLHTTGDGAVFANLNTWLYKTDLPTEQAERIYDKIARMIEREVEMAIPTFDLRMRAWAEGDATPGSLRYELSKTMTAYKSFLMTFTWNQWSRAVARKAVENPYAYGAQIIGGATLMGALVLQIGDLLRGRDLRPMDTPNFWLAAVARGGGAGPLADIAIASEASWGGGIGAWVMGPLPSLMEDFYKLTAGQVTRAARGEDTNFARQGAQFMRRHTPGWDLPWLGPLMDRLVAEQLMLFFDPEAVRSLDRGAQNWKQNYGNEEWWPRGSTTPTRAPELNVLSR